MISIQKILVPVDFSGPSKNAFTYGLTLAREFKAKLIVAHVVPESSTLAYAFPADMLAAEQSQKKMATEELKALVERDNAAGVDLETTVRVGQIGGELLGIVKEELIDLIVMGTHGRRHLGRWFLGSVTEQMLRKVPVPVLTVSGSGDGEHVPQSHMTSMKRILFAADLPEWSPGMAYAIEMARRPDAELTIVHVVEYLNLMYAAAASVEERNQRLEDMRYRFGEFVAREKPSGTRVETRILDGKPYKEILQVAEDGKMEMIVLNIQGKGILERAFLGSTAERVVRLAQIPVLSVPTEAALTP